MASIDKSRRSLRFSCTYIYILLYGACQFIIITVFIYDVSKENHADDDDGVASRSRNFIMVDLKPALKRTGTSGRLACSADGNMSLF